jgi:disease resistance protein RPM1
MQVELKVLSIVGSAGSGKTTLAMQVYDEIESQFDCTTFVSASRRPDVESLLGGLLINLGMREFSRTLELHEIIHDLREYLKDKRYVFFTSH